MWNRAKLVLWVALVMLGASPSGCGGARDPNADELTIGAYSVVQEVFQDGLIPAFQAHWQQKTGRSISQRVVCRLGSSGPVDHRGLSRGRDHPVARRGHGSVGERQTRQVELERGTGQGHGDQQYCCHRPSAR